MEQRDGQIVDRKILLLTNTINVAMRCIIIINSRWFPRFLIGIKSIKSILSAYDTLNVLFLL